MGASKQIIFLSVSLDMKITMNFVAVPVEAVMVQMEAMGVPLKLASMKTTLISYLRPNGTSKVGRLALPVITVNLDKGAEVEMEEQATGGENDPSYPHVCDKAKQDTGESLWDMGITVLVIV